MKRKTSEVDISVNIGVDGDIDTGDKILDHLLETLFFYMDEDVEIRAEGDLKHHLWEDVGITIGKALEDKIDDMDGKISRFGNSVMPMDDALILVSVDISRVFLEVDLDPVRDEKGFDVGLVREFLLGLVRNLGSTVHVVQIKGENSHHIIEAVFKGLGVSLKKALRIEDKVRSTKGEI